MPKAAKKTPTKTTDVAMEFDYCRACFKNRVTQEAGVGQSLSRYVRVYICSECGRREAFEGFFWSSSAKADPVTKKLIKGQ